MPLLQSAYRATRDVRSAGALTPARRRLWLVGLNAQAHRLWPDLGSALRVRLAPRPRRANGGYLLRGGIDDGRLQRIFWIKWCPEASRAELDATVVRMKWWRCLHPRQRTPVADVLAYWAEEAVLLLEDKPGLPLSAVMRQTNAATAKADSALLEQVVTNLAGWMVDYAHGWGCYDATTREHWGDEVHRGRGEALFVNARRLLEQRLALAEADVGELRKAGLSAAGAWQDRFDVDAILRSFTQAVPAGFIHGDFKPGNVLVAGTEFSLIDWWNAPRISWALPDAATFAASCWLDDTRSAPPVMWRVFAGRYFAPYDDKKRRTVDLLATMMCLRLLARMVQARGMQGWVNRLRAPRLLRRLVDPTTRIGAV